MSRLKIKPFRRPGLFFIFLAGFIISFHNYSVNAGNSRRFFMETYPTGKTTQLRILSWNIGMLPWTVILSSGGEKAARIGNVLKDRNYDIIVFEEAFCPFARIKISRELDKRYPYQYGPVNSGFSLILSSGLWILSRIPLTLLKQIEFTRCEGFDCFSRKGAVLLEGETGGARFQVIGTHLQSDDSDPLVRCDQMRELYQHLINPYATEGIPQIICGDLNTDHDSLSLYTEMLTILQCRDGELEGETRITFGLYSNRINNPSAEKPRQIDYILVRNLAGFEKVRRRVAVMDEYWYPEQEYLSDHFGIEALINLSHHTEDQIPGSLTEAEILPDPD